MLRTQNQRCIFSVIVFLLLFFGAIALINWKAALGLVAATAIVALFVFLVCKWAEWVDDGDLR